MARSEQPGEILNRALAYPYAAPERSFVQLDGCARELPAAGPDLDGRRPLLAYGANAAPEALARKLASLPGVALPVLRVELAGFDVVYSAHVSPYGAVPATLHPCPEATAPVFVLYPTPEQRRLLAATEPNYELTRLRRIELRLAQEAVPPAGEGVLKEVDAFLSRHGCLQVSGVPIALTAIRSAGRSFEEMDEAAVLESVRAARSPELDLEDFVVACARAGGLAPLADLRGP
ncbi:MAG TPA: hypothetical protein VF731_04940 [Solirubrobacterales bacterium]